MRHRRTLLGLLASAVFCAATAARASLPVPPGALGEDVLRDDGAQIQARLLVHPDDRDPQGEVRIGVLFDLAPGWHMYWRSPGETGLPPRLRFEVEGAAVGEIEWPLPAVFQEGDLRAYGYADRVLLATRVVPIANVVGPRQLRVEAEVLVCKYECIPARFSLARSLSAEEDPAPAASLRQLFARTAASVPRPADELGLGVEVLYSQSAMRPGDSFAAALRLERCARQEPGCDELELPEAEATVFFPELEPDQALDVMGLREHPTRQDAWLLALAGRIREGMGEVGESRLRGVVVLRDRSGATRAAEVDLPLPRAAAGAEIRALPTPWLESARPAGAGAPLPVGFARAFLLALLGGLILNLMPCVLPVLAIKVFSVTELALQSRREARAHGLAYAAGVLFTMAVLAALVIALRGAGAAVGWGFQFQEPAFILAISSLLVVFALNLFGVFEIQLAAGGLAAVGQRAAGARRSFFEGLLAVLLATPCTAPFLGTAVGFAFASSALVIVAIFGAIGLGLAAPFALIAFVPAWARLLPRPGAWMLTLRSALGFALLATVVWLAWVFGRSAGIDGVAQLLAFLLAVAFAAWIYGITQRSRPRLLPWVGAAALLALSVGAVGAVRVEPPEATPLPSEAAWQPYDPAAIDRELARGRRVFVSFTADWCITCKVNERLVLAHGRVLAELGRSDVATFQADWTRRDEAIRAELARFGKAGVPLYLVYTPEAPDRPLLLPELLTVDRVLEALRADRSEDRLAEAG